MLKKLLSVAVVALALSACAKPPTKEQAQEGIRRIMPVNFEVLQITELKDLPAVYEVVISVEGQPVVVYVDKKVRHVFTGSLMSVDPVANLTVESQKKYLKK